MSAMRIEVGPSGADSAAALSASWAVEDAAFEVWCARVGAPTGDLPYEDDLTGDGPVQLDGECDGDGVGGSLDEVAAWAAGAVFGSGVWTPFGLLDPAGLSDAGRVDALVAVERLRGWVDAHAARLLAALAPGPVCASDREWVKDEIGAALRQSRGFVTLRLHVARELTTRLTDTLDLLERG